MCINRHVDKGVENTRNGGFELSFKNKIFLPTQKHHTNVKNKKIKAQVFLSWFA